MTKQLEDDALTRCPYCGATVWLYQRPVGGFVALEDAPGGWVIDGRDIAHETADPVGYRAHWDHCPKLAIATLAPEVPDADFLWP